MRTLHLTTLALLLILGFTSCNRYPDGGSVGNAEKNILGTWVLQSYYWNGADNTSQLLISNLTETYNEDGTLVRTYTDSNGDPQSQSGTYTFDAEKSVIDVSGVGSIQLTNATSTASTSTYIILRLKNGELWYEFENGGDTHEFRFSQ